MKKLCFLTAALALVALSAACSKVSPVDGTPAAKMTISATLSNAATKVSFDASFDANGKPAGMSHTWEAGDQLLVTDASDPSVSAVFDLVDGIGTANGKFEGKGFAAASYDVEVIPNGTFVTGNAQTQAKDGATDHLKYVAAATGVTDLANISLTETSGIIGIIAKLPAGAAATINELEIETSADDFATSTKLTVALTSQEDADSDDILKVYANVPAGWTVPAGTKMFLRFGSTNADHAVYTRYQEFAAAAEPVEGKFNYMKFNCAHIDQYAGSADAGTEAAPYLIADKYQMDAVHALQQSGETTYYKMIADIDMDGITWIPLNNDGSFDKYIDFDGCGHTLSNIATSATTIPEYPSVFGVLNGKLRNLTVDNATIIPAGKKAGVIAGYIGSASSAVDPEVTNVHVINSTVGTAESRATNYVGGIAGQIQKDAAKLSNVTIENSSVYGNPSENKTIGGMIAYIKSGATLEKCHSTAYVDARAYVGGIVGFAEAPEGKSISISQCYYDAQTVNCTYRYAGGIVGHTNGAGTLTIQDCYVNGDVTAASGWAGSILGDHNKGVTRINNCYATGAVSAGFGAAGIVGQVNADGLSIMRCAVFNTSIKATIADENPHYSSGAVVAYAKEKKMSVNSTYRKSDLIFEECAGNSENVLPESNSSVSWLNNSTVEQGAHQYIYCYHGRKTEYLLTLLCQSIYGWDADIWDFSGSRPLLK